MINQIKLIDNLFFSTTCQANLNNSPKSNIFSLTAFIETSSHRGRQTATYTHIRTHVFTSGPNTTSVLPSYINKLVLSARPINSHSALTLTMPTSPLAGSFDRVAVYISISPSRFSTSIADRARRSRAY